MSAISKPTEKSVSALDKDRSDAIVREMDKLVARMRQVTDKLESKLHTKA